MPRPWRGPLRLPAPGGRDERRTRCDAIRDLIQEDVGDRGLRTDPAANLFTACADDFAAACRSLAARRTPRSWPSSPASSSRTPAALRRDRRPAGRLFLARALAPLGIEVVLATDDFCRGALQAGLAACGLRSRCARGPAQFRGQRPGSVGRLLAAFRDRTGPAHAPARAGARRAEPHAGVDPGQPGQRPRRWRTFAARGAAEHHDRCHTMRGRDITADTSPPICCSRPTPDRTRRSRPSASATAATRSAWARFPGRSSAATSPRRPDRLPGADRPPHRRRRQQLGGLRPGRRRAACCAGRSTTRPCSTPSASGELLQLMVERGPLVDGVTGQPTATVDGLPFERYAELLRRLGDRLLQEGARAMDGPHDTRRGGSAAAGPRGRADGADAGPGAGVRAGQPRRRAARPGLRLPALLPAQPEAVPAAGRDRARLPRAAPWPRRGRPAHRRAALPRLPRRRAGRRADRPARTGGATTWSASCSAARSPSRTPCCRPGVPVRHIEQGRNVPMYRTNIACRPAGVFRGPLVVSMRPMTPAQAVTGRAHLPRAFRVPTATPIHFGDPDSHRHPRPRPARLRRPGGDPPGRGAGLLGVRRHAAGGGHAGPAAAAADAQARATCSSPTCATRTSKLRPEPAVPGYLPLSPIRSSKAAEMDPSTMPPSCPCAWLVLELVHRSYCILRPYRLLPSLELRNRPCAYL